MARHSMRRALVTSLTTPSGIEEAVVESGEPKRIEDLEVKVVFEPSRIAPICVAQAYERVVPTLRRGITVGGDGCQAGCGEMGHRSGATR